MTKRFRMIAGPNGSGKSTLASRLERDYAVNFYDFLNADDVFAEVAKTLAYRPSFPIENADLVAYAAASEYDDSVKACFAKGDIAVIDECIRFASPAVVNSYTIALVVNFLQAQSIKEGRSFSQETVFSHPSKLAALESAKAAGYRTYLYYVATSSPRINLGRVANRVAKGGHQVPEEKILSRYNRSLESVSRSLEFLSRAYFFDNSGDEMRFLGEWNGESGFQSTTSDLPRWFTDLQIVKDRTEDIGQKTKA